jgi:tetratricopeptide (TPR) repeat protein
MSFGSSLPLLSRISNACESALAYLAQSLWPTGIAAFHPHPASRISIASGLGAALVLVFATAISLATRASRPYLAVGWLWYLSMLAPVSGIVQIGLQARAERYVYLPQIGLSLIVAWCVRELAGSGRRARAIAAGAGVIAIGVLAILAQREVGYWRDTRTLFERARAVTGDNFYAEQVLAGLDLEAGDAAAAERGYRRALAREPGYAPAMLGLGTALAVLDRHDEAVAALRDGLTIAPHAGGEAQLAALLADRGDLAEALDHFARAEELGNRALETQLAFASALRRAGRGSEARARLEALLTRDAAARAARLELAWLHATCAEPELRAPAAALSLLAPLLGSGAPRGARLLDVHAAALASSGELARAVEVAREAESLASASAAPERQKAAIRERRDRYEAGSAIADRCVASQSADGATRRQEQR